MPYTLAYYTLEHVLEHSNTKRTITRNGRRALRDEAENRFSYRSEKHAHVRDNHDEKIDDVVTILKISTSISPLL